MVLVCCLNGDKLPKNKKQMTGIEPASQPWEGRILPMNYICLTYKNIRNPLIFAKMVAYSYFWRAKR